MLVGAAEDADGPGAGVQHSRGPDPPGGRGSPSSE